MKFTDQQNDALREMDRFMKDPSRQVFSLEGYAGTGKTELAQHFANGVDGNVVGGAYTGKAALVLEQRGFPHAQTIHSLLYEPAHKSRAKLIELNNEYAKLNEEPDAPADMVGGLQRAIQEEEARLDNPAFAVREDNDLETAALVVLDEYSMVSEAMEKDLLKVCKKLVVIGDPFQLPPVKGQGAMSKRKPDVLLTEVKRHDNGVLDLATSIRGGNGNIPFGQINENVRKLDKRELTLREYTTASQLMTGRNVSRQRLNVGVRRVLEHDDFFPQSGDRLICLRNDRDWGLFNGLIATAKEVYDEDDPKSMNIVLGGFKEVLPVYKGHFERYRDPGHRLLPYYERREFQEFDFGYAITVHKSQGSQWEHPWLCDDDFLNWDAKMRLRWLYTAVTRAEQNLTIVA
jgi:exodeoxyribonuclease V